MKCHICGANDAETASEDMPLCLVCSEKVALQKDYEQRLAVVAGHLERRAFDQALEEIDVTERGLRDRDHDGWVHRALLADRAMVLREAGLWDEALGMFDARLALPFEDPAEQAGTGLGAALVLLQLGRDTEAHSRLASVLDALDRVHPQAILPNLLQWAEIGDVRMLDGRQRLIQDALTAHDLTAPSELGSDPGAVLEWVRTHWTH